MRSFFKSFFAALLALVIFFFLGFVLIIIFVSVAASSSKPEVGDKAMITIDLSKHFKEQEQENPLGGLVSEDEQDVPSLFDVVRLVEKASADNNVKGIYLECNNNANGFAASTELRHALETFRASGKFIIAYGEVISQNAYYIASVANKVYCNPQGMVEWTGLSSTLFFVKGTLERLQIQPQIFYAGKFKSATEPFRETQMTDANRLQTSVYLNDLYSQLLMAAAKHTGTDTAMLRQLADNGSIQNAKDAVQYKLIDAALYNDEVMEEISKKLQVQKITSVNQISIEKYAKAVDFKNDGGDKIAMIVAEGEIVDGKGSGGQIGSDEYLKLVRKARLDKSIKAIVLRVNSPGGSALASDIIFRELMLAKKEKPVVVSFGDVAASGGYYISCGADSIFTQPTTITGSIGVFALIPNMQNFFNSKLGVTFDRVKTGPYADMISVTRPLNKGEQQFIQNSIDNIYNDFKSRVSQGRNLSMDYVDSIAQGRVWTGEKAVSLKLADKLGDIQDAIDCAARMAKITAYRVREYPEKKGFFEKLMTSYRSEVKTKAIVEEIGVEQYETWMRLKNVKNMMMVPQARLPFDVNIK